MAVIGYIRKHSAIAVILVGISLVAFLVGPNLIDWARNVLGYSSGPGSKREVGIVNGKSISLAEFEGLTMENAELTKLNQQKQNLTASEIYAIKNQTWAQKLNEIIMQAEYDELGLTITPDEMIDQLRGNDPHRLVRQYFVDENNMYNPNIVVQYMQNVDQLPPADRAQWENFKEFIHNDRLNTKYYNLLKKAYNIPGPLARMEYKNTADIYKVSFVALDYANVPDSVVGEPTEEQYRDYYEETKHMFYENKSRDLEYVVFNIMPSEKDLEEIREETMEIYEEWTGSRDPGEYVNNIPGNTYDSTWYGRGELPVRIDSLMFASEVGLFVQPYKDGTSWYMARLMDRDVRPDSASAEHVLIAYQGAFRSDPNLTRTREEAEQLADSIYNVLRRDVAKLPEIAMELSDDGSAVNNNGNLGWFRDGDMVYAFNNAVINGKVGDIHLVESPFGYHIIHVTGLTEAEERVRVAMIEVPIEYSSETYDRFYATAARFAGENNTREKFEQAVVEQGLEKREANYVSEMQEKLPALENTRQVIRWAFMDDREVGDVSPLFDIGGKFVVAMYTKGRETGEVAFEDIRDRLELRLMSQLKFEYLRDQVEELGTNDINVIASKFDTKVDTVDNLSFNSRNILTYPAEYEVIGEICAHREGENTGIMKGRNALFVAEIDQVSKAAELDNYSIYTAQKIRDFETRLNNDFVFNALKDNSDIKDYRLYFY
jgi:peptidyl-prolyl cis-trans isomerase D